MRARLIQLSKRRSWRVLRWILLSLLLMVLLASISVLFDRFGWSAGFSAHTEQVGSQVHYERGKALWDWLDLLIIPAVLALGAFWANRVNQRNEQRRADRENQIEREIASERNQEAALQAYLDKMTDLLLKEHLRNSKLEDEVRTVARARTLTVLRGLDGERKGSVIRFLSEAKLIQGRPRPDAAPEATSNDDLAPVITLEDVDLQRAQLSGVDLPGAYLDRANLRGANLSGADLRGASLFNADLREGAELMNTWLEGAKLDFAWLDGAKHMNAACFDKQTTLPDGTKWTLGIDMRRFTDPN